jgi:uncharacterized protein (DUF1778 family)
MPANGEAIRPSLSSQPTMPGSSADRSAPAKTAGPTNLPEDMQSPAAQLQHMQRRLLALEARLAAAEKALATHRHSYMGVTVNQYNYRTLKSLLDNADNRDGLLNWPSLPRAMQTSAAVDGTQP